MVWTWWCVDLHDSFCDVAKESIAVPEEIRHCSPLAGVVQHICDAAALGRRFTSLKSACTSVTALNIPLSHLTTLTDALGRELTLHTTNTFG